MILGGAALGSVALGSVLQDPGTIIDPTSLRPILTELNGIDARVSVRIDTFKKQDTLGQPVTASLTFLQTETFIHPQPGDTVRVRYHESLEFAGTISRVRKRSPDLSTLFYDCELVDWSQILTRRLVRRNFTDMTVQGIVQSILENELAGEPITIGNIESLTTVPLLDASAGSRVFDLFRSLAEATGQTFFVDFNKAIQMRGTPATWDRGTSVVGQFAQDFILDESGNPILSESGAFILEEQQEDLQALNQATVLLEGTTLTEDRETYRNVQTVIVTGTPQVEDADALIVTVQRTNEDEIAARQAVEGGTGRYEELDEIVHPTSNQLDDLLLLGNGYADLRLATSGTLTRILTVQVRGYGFRAGQVGTVDLPTFGIVGEFMLQRVTLKEVGAQHLWYTLELTESSIRRRAYASWLTILGLGKIAIQLFGTIVHNSVTFTTPGEANWISPITGVVTLTCKGGSGGGAGGISWLGSTVYQEGGKGGNSGLVQVSVNVVEGEELNLTVGSKGLKGTDAFRAASVNGSSGTATTVQRAGDELIRSNPGGGGNAPTPVISGGPAGAAGTNGGGSGAIVTVGGGKVGGVGGKGTNNPGVARDGKDGDVKIEW